MKTKILEEYSMKSWDKLSTTEKSKHSLLNCEGCTTKEKYQTLINALPVNKQACSHNKQKILNHNMIQLQTITQHIYTKVNSESKKSFPDLEFSDALVMVPELNLSKAPTYVEKWTEIRKTAQDFKKAAGNHKKETAGHLVQNYHCQREIKLGWLNILKHQNNVKSIYSKIIMLLSTSYHGMKKNALGWFVHTLKGTR